MARPENAKSRISSLQKSALTLTFQHFFFKKLFCVQRLTPIAVLIHDNSYAECVNVCYASQRGNKRGNDGDTEMTRTEVKDAAQWNILTGAAIEVFKLREEIEQAEQYGHNVDDDQRATLKEMEKQLDRIRKFFGFENLPTI